MFIVGIHRQIFSGRHSNAQRLLQRISAPSGYLRPLTTGFVKEKLIVENKLMQHDFSGPLAQFHPLTGISFYGRKKDEDLEQTISYVSGRFRQILTTNPWLTGYVTKQKHEGQKDVYLSYEEEISSIDEYLTVIEDSKVFELSDINALSEYVHPLRPKRMKDCLDKGEKLCQLTVFHSTDLSKLALMFSLNHCLGDAATFYRIWKMLDLHQSVLPMVVERYHNLHEDMEQQTNLIPYSHSLSNKTILSMLGRGLKRKIYGNPPPKKVMYRIKTDEIEKQKRKYNTGNSFVSTMDILCTEILGSSNPSDGVMMVFNMRGQIPELDENNAGNYIAFCPVSFTETTTPRDFRDRWISILRNETQADRVNKAGKRMTNLAPLYHQVELPGCSHYTHMPVISIDEYVHTIFGIHITLHCYMILFQLQNNELGVWLNINSDVITEEYLENCKVLAGKVTL